jgi:predicted MFS family arabinose efflux permease
MRGTEVRESHLSSGTVWLMATASGITVANIYYNQPLLSVFSGYFHVEAWKSGLVATAAQVGYGLGLLFFVPLGDLLERRRLIVFLINACAVCLVAAALAPNLPFLIFAQLLVGLSAISAQILIPLVAEMARPEERGRLIGAIMSGILCGILLGRVVAGFISDLFGWRTVYFAAAISMLVLGLILRSRLPHRRPVVSMSYGRLMHSMLELARTQPALWSASLISALSFAGFSAFWTTLSFFLADRFHLGASEAGLFGIIGLIGAAGAPWAGTLSDRKGFGFTITLSLVLTALSFVLMGVWGTIIGLIVGVLLMDLGVQSIQVAAQASVISLLPEARSRLNTLYMVARFGGGAAGSAMGALAWSTAKWPGVCGFCLGLTLVSFVFLFRRPQRQESSPNDATGTEPG